MIEAILEKLRTIHRADGLAYIGKGAASVVYRGSINGVPSAFKISCEPIDISQGWVEKERRGLEVVKSICGHPHVVSLLDVWEIEGHLVTRWELGQGSLLDRLQECQREGSGGIPLEELLAYMREAAEGIDFLNGRGIFHRDIKPANLLLFHGHIKLADLGLAKFVGAATARLSDDSIVGTFGYIPPEISPDPEKDDQGSRLSKTSDLYSLAATYAKLRTGREPFGDSFHEVARRQQAGQPVLDGLERAEAKLIRKTLAPWPDDRPQDGALAWVDAVAKALQASRRAKRCPSGQRLESGEQSSEEGQIMEASDVKLASIVRSLVRLVAGMTVAVVLLAATVVLLSIRVVGMPGFMSEHHEPPPTATGLSPQADATGSKPAEAPAPAPDFKEELKPEEKPADAPAEKPAADAPKL